MDQILAQRPGPHARKWYPGFTPSTGATAVYQVHPHPPPHRLFRLAKNGKPVEYRSKFSSYDKIPRPCPPLGNCLCYGPFDWLF